MSHLAFMQTKKMRRGYAMLLGLAVVLVLGLVFYWMNMHGDVYEIGVGKSSIDPPWRQWHNMGIKYERKELGKPRREQLQLTVPLAISAEPANRDAEAGTLTVLIMPDGTMQGKWGGTFNISKDVDYQIMASQFKGHIDPDRMCVEDGWDEPSKLFFLTKGGFTILETNDGNGQCRSLGGDIYVRGWITPEAVVDGELIITSDRRKFRRFMWQGKATPDIGQALIGAELGNILGR